MAGLLPINRFQAGFRSVDGNALNNIVDAINTMLAWPGSVWYVSPNGSNKSGKSWDSAYNKVSSAVAAAGAGDLIVVGPGTDSEYDDNITIARTKNNLTIWAISGRGSASLAPSAANTTAIVNNADDVTLINIGAAGSGTGNGLTNTGSRLRCFGCKFEGDTGMAVQLTLGTVVQEAAGTHGTGSDVLLDDCETAWASQGVVLTCTDYGAVTESFIRRCYLHDHSAAAIDESVGSGGSAAVLFQGLRVEDCTFNDLEDGTAPTAFVLLNDDNANAGIVTRCSFPTALNGGKNLVSTALHWVCNYHTAGVSGAQPS